MSSFSDLYTVPEGVFVQSFPNGDDEKYVSVLITRENFNDSWEEMIAETFEEAEEELDSSDLLIFGVFNAQYDEFAAENLMYAPQFDVLLLFKHSEGGVAGPVYGMDVETAEIEKWRDSFEDCGFAPLTED